MLSNKPIPGIKMPTMTRNRKSDLIVLAAILGAFACSGGDDGSPAVNHSPGNTAATTATLDPDPTPPPELVAEMLSPFHGDFEAMVKRRLVRVLVVYNRTNFFLDGGTERGLTAESLAQFQKYLNSELKLGRRPLTVAAIPVARDQLIPYLVQGRGDIAAALLTITSEREQEVPFSAPVAENIRELVVTGPSSPQINSLDDLAGVKIVVRESSSYWESLAKLNASFHDRGLAPIDVVPANEHLETEDLLEMVNAGLIECTVADDYLARFWSQVFAHLVVHEDFAVASGRSIGWALRPDATGLKAVVDRFVTANRMGKLVGNMLFKRYLKDATYVENALASDDRRRFEATIEYFEKYGDRYGIEPLLLAAQGYQESRLNQNARSRVGAVGIMQLMPKTAAGKPIGIPDISTAENNIHAGAKYLRHIEDHYFDDPSIDSLDRALFAMASYNAGPSRIQKLRATAAAKGYDPDKWFRNMEVVVADAVGREPVQYVSNIFKYYTVYSLLAEQREMREHAAAAAEKGGD